MPYVKIIRVYRIKKALKERGSENLQNFFGKALATLPVKASQGLYKGASQRPSAGNSIVTQPSLLAIFSCRVVSFAVSLLTIVIYSIF